MPLYSYKTKDSKGAYRTGSIEKDTKEAAIRAISENNDVIISVTEKKGFDFSQDLFSSIKKVEISSIITFFTQFAFLIRVGVPLYQSIEMLITQTRDDKLAETLRTMKKNLAEGISLSVAMRRQKDIFTNLHINMIVVGESTGKLSEAFDKLVTIVNDEQEAKKKIKDALIYPIIMIVMSFLVVAGMLLFVFPKFSDIFKKTGVELPITTRVLMSLSETLTTNFPIILGSFVAIIILSVVILKSEWGKFNFDRIIFKIPVIKEIVINITMSNFARTLGSLLSSGVTLVNCLEICRETTTNGKVKLIMDGLIREVKEGKPMAVYFEKVDIFPSMFTQLIAIGETSGQMDVMTLHIYDYYKKSVDDSLKKFTTLIEPLLMVFMGVIVTVMAVSLFLPMFKLTGAKRH